MPTRDELERWDHDHVWHPFTPMQEYAAQPPLIVTHGEGVYVYDLDGRRYIDGTASMWCNVHGHRTAELDDAIRLQLDRVAHSTLLGLSNQPAIELARALAEVAPPGLSRVFYSDDGATAVEVALKMAYQYWQQRDDPKPRKTRFLALRGAYHGDTLGDCSVGDIGRFHSMFAPLLFTTHRAPSPHCYRCPLGLQRPTCDIACVAELGKMVEQHADELVAVVMEPLVQCAAGMITAPEGYLKRVREITQQHGVLLILDEVAVGFGRTGTLFACEQESVVPDFLCIAKGLTGGYLPLAATLTNDEIYRAFLGRAQEGKTFFHGHTFTGNPLGCAVALASLRKLREELLPQLPARIATFQRLLKRFRDLELVGDIRQKGLLAGIELVANRVTRELFPDALQVGKQLCRLAREQGVLIRPLRDTIVIMPPLAIDESLLEQLLDIVYNCILILSSELGSAS